MCSLLVKIDSDHFQEERFEDDWARFESLMISLPKGAGPSSLRVFDNEALYFDMSGDPSVEHAIATTPMPERRLLLNYIAYVRAAIISRFSSSDHEWMEKQMMMFEATRVVALRNKLQRERTSMQLDEMLYLKLFEDWYITSDAWTIMMDHRVVSTQTACELHKVGSTTPLSGHWRRSQWFTARALVRGLIFSALFGNACEFRCDLRSLKEDGKALSGTHEAYRDWVCKTHGERCVARHHATFKGVLRNYNSKLAVAKAQADHAAPGWPAGQRRSDLTLDPPSPMQRQRTDLVKNNFL